jgi:hypothetical protein
MKFNTIKLFRNKIYEVNNCPLCKSSKKKLHSHCNKNLYSEFLSKIIKVDEENLIKYINNYQCLNCDLIYKNFWFKDKVLSDLFSKKILSHPKGMDIHKNNFNKKFFFNELKKLKHYYNKNFTLHNKSKRTIGSVISAIKKNSPLKNKLIKEINSKKLNFQEIYKISLKVSKFITHPKKFSRYVGYDDQSFWNFIKKNSVKIDNYAEVGCPSWGLLKRAKADQKKIVFYKRKENNFWNEKNGCLKKTKLKKKEIITNLNKIKKISLFGIIEYLDHLSNPYKFIKEINSISLNFFIILENDNKAVQHFTSWTNKSLKFLSFKLKKKVNIFNNYTKTKNIVIAIYY